MKNAVTTSYITAHMETYGKLKEYRLQVNSRKYQEEVGFWFIERPIETLVCLGAVGSI